MKVISSITALFNSDTFTILLDYDMPRLCVVNNSFFHYDDILQVNWFSSIPLRPFYDCYYGVFYISYVI